MPIGGAGTTYNADPKKQWEIQNPGQDWAAANKKYEDAKAKAATPRPLTQTFGPNAGKSIGSPPGILGAGPYKPPLPQPTPLPSMPFNFNAMANMTGAGGGGGGGTGGGGGGGGTGSGGGGGAASMPPGLNNLSSFQGAPSSWMEDAYKKALGPKGLYNTAPDMFDAYNQQARDSIFNVVNQETKNLTGRLGSGSSSPAAASRVGDFAARSLNSAAAMAAKDKFGMQLGALQVGGGLGKDISGDLRAQEALAQGAFNATTGAWTAGQQADIARQRLGLEGQIASMNAMLGFYTPWMNAMGNMYGGAASGGGFYGGSSGYNG